MTAAANQLGGDHGRNKPLARGLLHDVVWCRTVRAVPRSPSFAIIQQFKVAIVTPLQYGHRVIPFFISITIDIKIVDHR